IWLSYALIVPDATPEQFTPEMMAELRGHFRRCGRQLRFEVLEPLWPWAGPLLESHGVQLQGRMPLMICRPGQVRPMPAPSSPESAGIELRSATPADSDELIREYLMVAKESFGDCELRVSEREVAEQREHLASGRYTCAYVWWGEGIA